MSEVVTSVGSDLALFSDPSELRKADKKTKKAAIAVAESVIFDIFGNVDVDRSERKASIMGGVYAGKAIASVLRAVYGRDGITPGTLTNDQIATTFSMGAISIKGEKGTGVQFALASLVKLDTEKRKSIADKAEKQSTLFVKDDNGDSVRAFSDDDINTAKQTALDNHNAATVSAKAYITNNVPLIPDAVKVIRTAHNGTVKRSDGVTMPVEVAIARVLMNVADKAIDVADTIIRKG